MGAYSYKQLKRHVGHNICCVDYGDGENIAIECEDCNEILMDFDLEGEDNDWYKANYCPECCHSQINSIDMTCIADHGMCHDCHEKWQARREKKQCQE